MLKKAPKGEYVLLNIEDLRIDDLNMRHGEWNYDSDFVRNIKERGVQTPILVRPNPLQKNKYLIVCGSRRYNASIDAGLKRIPAIIRCMTDEEAMDASYEENIQRSNPPKWLQIEAIGQMVEQRGIGRTSKKTGHLVDTITRYWKIYRLPYEIKGLIRNEKERSKRQKEFIKRFYRSTIQQADLTLLEAISYYLYEEDLDKMMQVAIFCIQNKIRGWNTLAHFFKQVRKSPNLSISQIWRKMIKEPRIMRISLYIPEESDLGKSLITEAMGRQQKVQDLVFEIVTKFFKQKKGEIKKASKKLTDFV